MNRIRFDVLLAHPGRVAVAVAVVTGVGALQLDQLRFDASYAALMPDDAPMMRELERVKQALGGGTSDVIAVIEGPDAQREQLARQLAQALADHSGIAWVDDQLPAAFFEHRALMMIPLADVKALEQRIQRAYRQSLGRKLSLLREDEDEEEVDEDGDHQRDPWQPVREFADQLSQRVRPGSRYRSHDSADGRYRYVFIRPRVAMAELARARAIMDDIRATATKLSSAYPDVRIHFAGRLAVHLAEQRSTAEDMSRATGLALILIILVVVASTRRLVAPLVIAVPLVVSLELTLIASTLVVDSLNLMSAFTLPALVGLGVDFGIHLYLRYLSESTQTRDARSAMSVAIRETIGASATSAGTTALAFFSLTLVDFRGFREFGMLGGGGVLITFVTTYATLPALALISGRPRQSSTFACSLPGHVHRLASPIIVAVAVCAGGLAGYRLSDIRFENDFAELKGTSPAIAYTEAIEDDLGVMLSPSVFMAPDAATLRALEVEARALRERAPSGRADVGVHEILSINDVLPRGDAREVQERMRVMQRIEDVVGRAFAFGKPSPDDERALERLLDMCDARPWSASELPASLSRRLLSGDGTTSFIYVWPSSRLYRDTEMRAWVARMDELLGRVPGVSLLDERRIPIAIMDMVADDLPQAMLVAGLLVLLVLVVHFRRAAAVLAIAGTVVIAVVGTLGILAAIGRHINVYSAVVLPCLVGIGIDNAVHIQHAHDRARAGERGRVARTTRVAAVLSSVTTGIGFGATVIARQGGLRSMGVTAVCGVACILLASTVVLPAWLSVCERMRTRDSKSPADSSGRLIQ